MNCNIPSIPKTGYVKFTKFEKLACDIIIAEKHKNFIIFEYVFHHMSDKLPASIIILTDGYAPFPQEKLAGGIPVLWLLNNEEVNPPWGKVARITV